MRGVALVFLDDIVDAYLPFMVRNNTPNLPTQKWIDYVNDTGSVRGYVSDTTAQRKQSTSCNGEDLHVYISIGDIHILYNISMKPELRTSKQVVEDLSIDS